MLIAVSGNIGSGKTTLAKYLSENYDFRYVPKRRLEFDFIDDFFNNIESGFFPAQVSFLISKAIEIQELVSNHHNIVVDRSILEDIQVFARLWIENRQIDHKIVQLYKHTANFIRTAIPTPDLYIVCRCPAEVSRERIALRPKRTFEGHYPHGHIEMLENYYSELIFEKRVPYVEIDTVYHDFTKSSVLESICMKVFMRYENRTYYQLSLFEDQRIEPLDTPGLVFHNFENIYGMQSFRKKTKAQEYIYFAAPFTQFATKIESTLDANRNQDDLLGDFFQDIPYGELPTHYRNILTKIERAIEKHCGVPVLLPHRDINKWGKVAYPTEYVTPKIVETVKNSIALIAVPGCSIGVHLEIGVALAKGIPIVIFDVRDSPSSFFIEGFARLRNVKYIAVSSFSQIPLCIETERISEFIKNNRGEL